MPVAVLAGIPSRYLPKLKKILIDTEEWAFAYVPSSEGPDLRIKDLSRIHAEAERLGSIHVLGFSKERDKSVVAGQIRRYFRFRWIDNALLQYLNLPDATPFAEHIKFILLEEAEWGTRVRPHNEESALLLPEDCFGCSGMHRDVWLKAEKYGSDDAVPTAEKAIDEFTRVYRVKIVFQTRGEAERQQSKWMDDHDLVFDERGAKHGIAPKPRNWKYSYRITNGFHYDVSKSDAKGFHFRDTLGEVHIVANNGYINIDPHGYPRST